MTYCKFWIGCPLYLRRKGLYCFVVDGKLKYIGKSIDSFGKRINQGYGCIHPKNCYLDGQATNCHLNSLIAGVSPRVEFYICPLDGDAEINRLEKLLIHREQSEWNIALKRT